MDSGHLPKKYPQNTKSTVDLRLAKAKQEPTEALAKPHQKYHFAPWKSKGYHRWLWGIHVAINLKLRFKHTTNNFWNNLKKIFQACFCRLVSVSWMFSSKLVAESVLKTVAEANLWRCFGWKVPTSNLDQLTDHAGNISATAWNALFFCIKTQCWTSLRNLCQVSSNVRPRVKKQACNRNQKGCLVGFHETIWNDPYILPTWHPAPQSVAAGSLQHLPPACGIAWLLPELMKFRSLAPDPKLRFFQNRGDRFFRVLSCSLRLVDAISRLKLKLKQKMSVIDSPFYPCWSICCRRYAEVILLSARQTILNCLGNSKGLSTSFADSNPSCHSKCCSSIHW